MLAKTEAKIDANQKRMDAWIVDMRTWRKETTACQEATEACLESKEPTSLEVESVAEHEEIPKEEASVQTSRALKKRYGDRHLSVKRRGQRKKRTQGNGVSRKNLPAARRGFTRRAGVAWRKRRGFTGLTVEQTRRKKRTRDSVARGTSKTRTFGKRRRTKPEGITGIRNQSSRQLLCLRKERTTGISIRGRSRRQELRLGSQT
jgi:hypothetical protein